MKKCFPSTHHPSLMMRSWLSSGKTSRVLRFHFVPKKNSVCVRVHCQVHPLKFMVFEPTIAVESGRAKNRQRNQMLQLVWGYSKLQATRPKERPKDKRVKDTLSPFLTLVYSFTTTTSNPLEEATLSVLINYYWSTT